MFKLTFLFSLQLALFLPAQVFADETIPEKAVKHSNSSVRAVKKGMNRVGETFCMESDLECLAKKAGNRVEEAKDATVDGAKAVKEKMD